MDDAPRLQGWTMLSLRPRGGHAGLRAAARRAGAGFIALAPLRIVPLDDAGTLHSLTDTLACPRIVVTSANAVDAAARLGRLPKRREWIAVGAGTAAALRRHGIARIAVPTRADSEGLLALPTLQTIEHCAIGLLTGRGGRGLLQPAMASRGARVLRADVYARLPARIPASAWQRLRVLVQSDARLLLALTSAEAWDAFSAQLPHALHAALRRACVIAASARLAALARETGFRTVQLADGPRPAQLIAEAIRVTIAARVPE